MNRQPGEPYGSAPEREAPSQGGDGAREGMERARDAASGAREQAEQGAMQARERASQAAEQGEERAAEGMEQAASMIRDRADGTPAAGAAMKAADGMERSADYLRKHDTNEMWQDVEHYVREHPVAGIAGSVAAGFLVGRLLK